MSSCPCCSQSLTRSQHCGRFKSCPRCSREHGEHIFYAAPEAFGLSAARINASNVAGIQSHCAWCRGGRRGAPAATAVPCRQLPVAVSTERRRQQALRRWFAQQRGERLVFALSTLDGALPGGLPALAWQVPGWWWGYPTLPPLPQQQAWGAAGYRLQRVQLGVQVAAFSAA